MADKELAAVDYYGVLSLFSLSLSSLLNDLSRNGVNWCAVYNGAIAFSPLYCTLSSLSFLLDNWCFIMGHLSLLSLADSFDP